MNPSRKDPNAQISKSSLFPQHLPLERQPGGRKKHEGDQGRNCNRELNWNYYREFYFLQFEHPTAAMFIENKEG